MPPGRGLRLNENEIPDAIWLRYEQLVMNILSAREGRMIGGKVSPAVFPLTRAAWDTLIEYQHRHAALSDYETTKNATIEGKFLTNVARIALNLHVAGLIESKTLLSNLTPISGETMLNACIITEWFTEEAKRACAALTPKDDKSKGDDEPITSGFTPEQRAVMLVLQRRGKPMTGNEIRGRSSATKAMSVAAVDKVLQELKKLKKVDWQYRKRKNGEEGHVQEWKIIEIS
jgi:hypothetical protein